jgi:hypothetical protein
MEARVCEQHVETAASWLEEQGSVTWVELRHVMHAENLHASVAIQGGNVLEDDLSRPGDELVAQGRLPFWSRGITGKNQVCV